MFGRRAAATVANSAQTAALKNALTKYLAATKNMNRNGVIKAINNKPNGGNKSYKNLIANSIAQIVANSRKAIAKAANAVATGAPETPAAEAVNNAAKRLANLNRQWEFLQKVLPNLIAQILRITMDSPILRQLRMQFSILARKAVR